MSLAPGSRLGPYEILSPLGAGGMGEVFRARDSRLGREVAIKVLPEHLGSSPEVRARFEREAKTASSLNHPHICVVYDVGREGDTDYLVMELVDGETLSARLARGPLPVAEVLRIGVQVGDALEKAHRAGVIHRDLKPGNIMLTRSGAKLIDFGLARATGLDGARASSSILGVSQSPTMAQPLTAEGSIVGTFQYMSPEQLEGREADVRSDLWSFGCVLYEMATGRRAFDGRSQASLISSIMKDEPRPIPELAPLTPPALDRAVRTCLAKDPDERWQTAGDLRRELQWILNAGSQAGVPAAVASRRRNTERVAWVVAMIAGLAAIALALAPPFATRGLDDVTRLALPPVPGLNYDISPCNAALSPDGRTVAIAFTDTSGASWLYTWRLSDPDPVRVAESRGAYLPFWSPDSRTIAFFDRDDEALKKVPASGGVPVRICASGWARGGSWSRNGTIVFAPDGSSAIDRVSSGGGDPVPVTTLDSTLHQSGHRFPWFLPDGRHFLFVALPGNGSTYDVFVGSLDGGRPRHVLQAGSGASYAEAGWLLFPRDGRIMAQRFDARSRSVRGDPVPIETAPPIGDMTGGWVATLSRNGRLLTYRTQIPETRLQWFQPTGIPAGVVTTEPGVYFEPHLSPDGGRISLTRVHAGQRLDVTVVDMSRNITTSFSKSGSNAYAAVWSPDGSRIAFSSNRSGREEAYIQNSDGSGEPRVLKTNDDTFKHPMAWSPDGKWLVVATLHPGRQFDQWAFPVNGEGAGVAIQVGADNSELASLSPDGRWVAFQSDVSGRNEIYLQSFPVPGRRIQVSSSGGVNPRWAPSGHELYFGRTDGTLSEVSVLPGDPARVSEPRALLHFPEGTIGYEVARDGRILAVRTTQGPLVSAMVISNWQKLTEKR
jgi:Tol biopolymer transport system component